MTTVADELGKGDLVALIADTFGLEDWPKDGAPYYLLTRDEIDEIDEIVSGVDFAPEVGLLADAVWDHLSAARDERDTARAAGDRAIDVKEATAERDRLLAALTKARELNNQMAEALDHDELNDLGRALDDVITAALGKSAAAS